MRYMGIGLLAPAFVLAALGCATKGYVREVAGQTEAKLDSQLGDQSKRVDAQARRIDEQATRVNAQGKQLEETAGHFTKIETSVDEFGNIARTATSRADEAYTRADEANTRAEEVNKRVTKLWASRHQRKLVETIHVQFGLDRADLTDAAQTALAELIKELAAIPSLEVDLEGYTDALGSREHNLQLSERRVAAVRRFLAQRGVELARINWIGMGELTDKGTKADPKNRRVTVRLMLPADDMTAQQTGAKVSTDAMAERPADAGAKSDEPAPPKE
jgi:outer membrane protein OmpA-like peptidoglycan-associated protein